MPLFKRSSKNDPDKDALEGGAKCIHFWKKLSHRTRPKQEHIKEGKDKTEQMPACALCKVHVSQRKDQVCENNENAEGKNDSSTRQVENETGRILCQFEEDEAGEKQDI